MNNYVYIILNVTKPGRWVYKDKIFDYMPIYVGMGVGKRYKQHLTTALSKNECNKIKFNTIKKLIENGNPPISIKIYENLDRRIAEELETDIIKHFGKIIDKTGILTNISNGGSSSPCSTPGKENPNSRKIYQYTLDGEFIKEWGNGREVERDLNFTHANIGSCCRGEIKTAYGYQWSYIFKSKKIKSIKIKSQPEKHKKVYKFDDLGNLREVYETLIECSLKNNVSYTAMSKLVSKNKFYNHNFYSYDKNFTPKINDIVKTQKHKIESNGSIMFLTNEEIMEIFSVSRFYFTEVRRGRIKKPKFNVIY